MQVSQASLVHRGMWPSGGQCVTGSGLPVELHMTSTGCPQRRGRNLHIVHRVVPKVCTQRDRWHYSALLCLRLDAVGQFGDLVVHTSTLGHELSDLAIGVHNGGVIAAAKLLTDLGK